MLAPEGDSIFKQSGEDSGIEWCGPQVRDIRLRYDGLMWLLDQHRYLPQTQTIEQGRDLSIADAVADRLGTHGEQRDYATAAIYGLIRYMRVTLADQGKDYQIEPPY